MGKESHVTKNVSRHASNVSVLVEHVIREIIYALGTFENPFILEFVLTDDQNTRHCTIRLISGLYVEKTEYASLFLHYHHVFSQNGPQVTLVFDLVDGGFALFTKSKKANVRFSIGIIHHFA